MDKKTNSNIEFGRDKAVNAFSIIADAVGLSLGASGSNVLIQTSMQPFYLVTPDGGTIVDEAHFEDEYEELGANVAREMTKSATDKSGDGRKTTIVLGDAILKLGKEYSNMDIKDSLDECIPYIIRSIDEQKKLITTDEEIKAVATISSRNAETGAIIAEIYKKIGKDGMIEIDNSRIWKTYYEEKLGLTFPQAGLVSPVFETSTGIAEWEKPYIFITDLPVSLESDILPIAQMVKNAGKNNLVVVCDKIGNGALKFLADNQNASTFNFIVVNAPTIMKEYFFEDFAKATGATLINAKSGLDLKKVKMEHLGTCDKIISNKDETRLIGTLDLTDYIANLSKERLTGLLIERLRRLNTKVAVLYMSAESATDLKYKKDKAEDAKNATRLALQSGIVAGGGVALLNVSRSLPNTIGGKILRYALTEPIKKIIENSHCSVDRSEVKTDLGYVDFDSFGYEKENDYDEEIEWEFRLGTNGVMGFDAKKKEITNMFDAGIIDSAQVTKNSVISAITIAGTFLSTKVMMANKKVEQPQMPFMPGM